MGKRAAGGDDEVQARGEKLAGVKVEDGGGEGAAGVVLDVETNEIEDEGHAIFEGREELVREGQVLVEPGGKGKGKGFHE